MARVEANGIGIEVEVAGKPSDPPIVLIRGLGTQLIQWPAAFVARLLDAGLRVVTFDNRDVGLSQKFDAAGTPDLASILTGGAEAPYALADMANDVCGVLDALVIDSAHIAGISMGGMIAQHVAARHAERTRSLASIMSSSGAPGLPGPTPEAGAALTSRPERPDERESVIAHGVKTRRIFGSPGYPTPNADLRREVERAYDRCHHPAGVARQLAAVVNDGSRVEMLGGIGVATLVIHGAADPLVPIECGRHTAASIPGAAFEAVEGMGHDIPPGLAERLADRIGEHAARAEAAR